MYLYAQGLSVTIIVCRPCRAVGIGSVLLMAFLLIHYVSLILGVFCNLILVVTVLAPFRAL